jgi:uncharacterized protein YecE (DUF72 family)
VKSSQLRAEVRIGCAGWNIPRAVTSRFACGASHLERYALVFNACEINSTFYRPHKIETWERWRESVPANFKFSVKAPRKITHESALNCGAELFSPFLRQIRVLKEKLGPILFQLPPRLEYQPVRTLRFLSMLREFYQGSVVWEPRHPSWFVEEVDELLKEFHVARVAADPACVPSAARPGGWSSLVYYRLHGSPRTYYSPYTDNFLSETAAQFAQLSANSAVWGIFDNTAAGASIPNALTLQSSCL